MTERKNLVASILARLKNIAKENDVVYGVKCGFPCSLTWESAMQ